MSARFTEGRAMLMFMLGVCSAAFGLLSAADPEAPVWVTAASATVLFGIILPAISLSRADNHGRGRTNRSRVQRLAARTLVGPIKPCGCWDDADAESIERDHYVRFNGNGGGKVEFEARKRLLRRCHACGRHYHTDTSAYLKDVGDLEQLTDLGDTSGFPSSLAHSVNVWPEDEPAAREAFTEPVEDTR